MRHQGHGTEAEVAEAPFAAATEEGSRIRHPVGADSKLLAELRWSTSEEHYLQKMREIFGPRAQARRSKNGAIPSEARDP